MVNKGTGIQQKTDHLPNPSSFHGVYWWWVLVHFGPHLLWQPESVWSVAESPGTSFSERLGTKVFAYSLQLHNGWWLLSSHEDPLNGATRMQLGLIWLSAKHAWLSNPSCLFVFFSFFADFSCCTKHVYFVIRFFGSTNRVIQKVVPQTGATWPQFHQN